MLYVDFTKKGNKLEKSTRVIIKTFFVQERYVTQRGDMLKTIDGQIQLIHADVADLNFFSKTAVAPRYCFLCIDLFTSKTYTYGMKSKSQLADKLEKFYTEIEILRKYLKGGTRYCIRLQTDQEFNQNEIKETNKKHDVEHYNANAVGTEQNIMQ